eukprot:TRINITY_DN14062_c0_g1_i2.p1 TRINITY_DN14062_c0_g1~~TRINITY_DN14062_c0_g1_i2.p1  ORF type:complete len:229 (+),score=28.88 TRINITY_DN14062_c0_g1_i2:61-747(+)
MKNRGFVAQPPPATYEVEMGSQVSHNQTTTLNEPIRETIMRDLRMIWVKLTYVLNPRMRSEKGEQLKQWDLWGPLLLCLLLALTLTIKAPQNAESIFGTIFVIIWAGAFVVTLNAKFLDGQISFFQSVCVLGYCVFPINIISFVFAIFGGFLHITVRFVIVGIAFFWSTVSSVGFMAALVDEDKKLLTVYPVFLFYLFLSWFVLVIQMFSYDYKIMSRSRRCLSLIHI